jgi:hypothetical protein
MGVLINMGVLIIFMGVNIRTPRDRLSSVPDN